MKRTALLIGIFLSANILSAQTYALDNSVLLSATTSTGPDAVTLQWRSNASATQYKVYRKLSTGTSWGFSLATLPSTDSVFTDNTVVNGTAYEYRVERVAPTTAYGYVMSGVNTAMPYNHGIMLLVVDSFFI